MNVRFLLCGLVIIAVMACGNPATPGAPTEPPAPLTPEGWAAVEAVEPIREEDRLRRPGLILLFAEDTFNTGTLRSVHPELRLLLVDDHPSTKKQTLVVAVPDPFIDEALERIRELPGILDAQPYVIAETQALLPDDPLWSEQNDAGMWLLKLPVAWWLTGAGHSSVTVAVVDTGIAPVSPELDGRIVPGYSFVTENPAETNDPHGHGTMVASIIAARKDNRFGIAGVASNVKVMPLRACTPWIAGASRCEPPNVQAALEYAFDHRDDVDVVNLSLGSETYYGGWEYFLDLLDKFGVIAVAAAGVENAGVYYPASSPHVIGVGGLTPLGGRDPLSNYGSELDMAAPFMTRAIDNAGLPVWFPGTSGSAAVISGVAALYKSGAVQEMSSRMWFKSDMSLMAILAGKTWNSQIGWGAPRTADMMWFHSCRRVDFNGDREIDVADVQAIYGRYGTYQGQLFFDPRFDVQPTWGDGDIDIVDTQRVTGRQWFHCR